MGALQSDEITAIQFAHLCLLRCRGRSGVTSVGNLPHSSNCEESESFNPRTSGKAFGGASGCHLR